MTRENSFDRLWHDTVTVAYGELNRHLRLLGTHVEGIRRQAYRFAKGVLELRKQHINKMVALIKSEGKTLQQWLDDHFAVIEQMGDTRERIAAAIESGVTEAEYVAEGEIAIVRKRLSGHKIKVKDDGVVPQPATTFASTEEKADYFRDLFESMTSKYQAVRAEARTLRSDLYRAVRRVDQLERSLRRVKKDIEAPFAKVT